MYQKYEIRTAGIKGRSIALVLPHRYVDGLKISNGDLMKIHQDGATIVLEKLVLA